MTEPIVLKTRGEFPKKSFTSIARQMWVEFFKIVPETCNLAQWRVHADSATVGLTARNCDVYEGGPQWNSPTPIFVLVDGIIERFSTCDRVANENLRSEFQQWAVKGVRESFESARIQKLYRSSSLVQEFAIVVAPRDEELLENELALVWSSNKKFTIAKIIERQREAKRRSPKARAVKKVRR